MWCRDSSSRCLLRSAHRIIAYVIKERKAAGINKECSVRHSHYKEDNGKLKPERGNLFDEFLFAEEIISQKIHAQICNERLAEKLYIKASDTKDRKDYAGDPDGRYILRYQFNNKTGDE